LFFHFIIRKCQAEVEGPQSTPYEKRFFRLKLVLGVDFPNSPPRGFFLTKIYHPNVDMTTGAICVNTLKKDWSAKTTFSHILSVIRCLLIYPFPESSLNDEAGKLFMESYDEYSKRARLMADVHGRAEPTNMDGEDIPPTRKSDSKNDEDSDEGDSPQRQKTRIDPTNSSASNPLTNKDSSNNIAVNSKGLGGLGSTAKPGKSMGQKQPSQRLTKKKSLKRL
jgi:ubiquitin-conjugating enzyme E2 S